MKTLPISISILVGPISDRVAELWLQRRSESGPLDGTWEFPGGKIEAGESPPIAAARELKEEVGIEVEPDKLEPFKTYTYKYPDRSVCLFVHLLYFSHDSKYQESLPSEGWKKLNLVEDSQDFFPSQEEWVANIPEANKEILKDLGAYLFKNQNDQNWRRHWQQLSC